MYRSLIIHVAAVLLVGAAAPAAVPAAGQEAPESVSLSEALGLWGRNNPELQAARSRLGGALGAARQGRAIRNPTASFTNEDLGGYSEQYFNISQSVDFVWQSGPRSRRAEARSGEAHATFLADSARIVLELKQAFVRAWERRQIVTALEEADLTVARVLKDATARFAQHDLAGYDLRRLRVAQAAAALRLATSRVSLADAERRLGAMLAEDGSLPRIRAEELRSDALPRLTHVDATERALRHRPELAAAEALVRTLDAEASLVGRSRLSGTALTAGFKHQSDGREGLFLGFQLPLPVLDRKSGALAAAEALVEGSRSELESLRRAAALEAELAAARLESALRLGSSLEDGGDVDARQLLESATVAYVEGEVGVVELIDAADAFTEARSLAANVQAEVWAALFDLEYAIGGLPEDVASGGER